MTAGLDQMQPPNKMSAQNNKKKDHSNSKNKFTHRFIIAHNVVNVCRPVNKPYDKHPIRPVESKMVGISDAT